MIPKEERDKDKAICDAATPGPWWQGDSDEAPRMDACEGGALGDDRLGSADEVHSGEGGPDEWIATEFRREEDARFTAAARNRLPAYIAALDEMERRIAEVEARLKLANEAKAEDDPDDAWPRGYRAAMREVVKVLRGGR